MNIASVYNEMYLVCGIPEAVFCRCFNEAADILLTRYDTEYVTSDESGVRISDTSDTSSLNDNYDAAVCAYIKWVYTSDDEGRRAFSELSERAYKKIWRSRARAKVIRGCKF